MGLMLDQYKGERQSGKSLLEILGGHFRAVRRLYPPSACSQAVSAAHCDKRLLHYRYRKERAAQAMRLSLAIAPLSFTISQIVSSRLSDFISSLLFLLTREIS